jgi:hypothetical protein
VHQETSLQQESFQKLVLYWQGTINRGTRATAKNASLLMPTVIQKRTLTMSTIEELRKKRFNFLRLFYDKSGGDRFSGFDMWEIGDELGFARDETERITDYLVGENLLEHQGVGAISLTHFGIREVEEALSHPERPTHHFPAVNIINIHHMEGSQIQQGVISSNQSGTFEFNNKNDISAFIELLKSKFPDLRLRAEEESELKSDVGTASIGSGLLY